MGLFEQWPYTNFHDLNLNWIISRIKHIDISVAQSQENADNAVASAEASAASAVASAASAEAAQSSADNAQNSAEASAESAQDSQESAETSAAEANRTAGTASAIRNEMSVLNARMDTIVASGTPTEGNAELIDIRTAFDGVVYQTAGSAVRGQINGINAVLGLTPVDLLEGVRWVVGTINSIGQFNDGNTTRIRTDDYVNVSGLSKITFELQSGYKLGWHFYNINKEHVLSADVFVTANTTVEVPENAEYLMLNMGNSSDDTAQTAWSQYVKAYKFDYSIITDVSELQTHAEKMDKIVNLNADVLDGVEWQVGTVGGSGNIVDSNTTRIRTKNYVNIEGINELYFEIPSGYKVGWHFYNADKTHILSAVDWMTGNTAVPVPANSVYLMVNMGDAADNEGDISWGSLIKAIQRIPLIQSIDIGQGNNSYYGEKIDLSLSNKVFNCDIELWKAFNGDISQYELYLNQSIALFGNYLFMFQDGGKYSVADTVTKELLTHGTFEPMDRNHNNAAQFSDIYYVPSDEFPLLFISRCGNTTSGTGDDTCLVYRVVRTGTQFNFTLINTIAADFTTYGNSWCIDTSAKTISMATYRNGSYGVTVDNPVCFYTWRMPDAAEVLSGNLITLTLADAIAQTKIDYVLLQSAQAFGNKVYICAGVDNVQSVLAVNVAEGRIETRIPIIDTDEIEGGYIYNGAMYVSHRVHSESAQTPLKIYKVTF